MPSRTPAICASESFPTWGRSDPRSMYSIEMYGVPSCSKNSCTVTMFGWLSEPAMRDSRRNRSAKAGSEAWNAPSSFSATFAVEIRLPGEIDDRHAAPAELSQDLVPANRPLNLQQRAVPLTNGSHDKYDNCNEVQRRRGCPRGAL